MVWNVNTVSSMLMFVFSAMLVGCQTPGFRENMLADGNSWTLTYGAETGSFEGCRGLWSDSDSCVQGALPFIKSRGEQLCGSTPHRIYACGRLGINNLVNCHIQCKAVPERSIRKSDEPLPTKATIESKSELLKKAKKCQEKGGVWIDSICQIAIE